jgi:predicted ArsR family transcriptional regulator
MRSHVNLIMPIYICINPGYNAHMSKITARQRVVGFLRRRKTATAALIAQGLGMSAASVRYHLGVLSADGRVVAEKAPGALKRGRPEQSYRLSERVLGDNLGMLAEAALVSWFEHLSEDDRHAAIQHISERVSEQVGSIDSALAGPKRMVQLVERLTALNYEAGWEAGAQGPRIVLGHCPYAAIIARHPELCRMDAHMLSVQMGSPAEQLLKMEQKPGGPNHCVFAIGERRSTSQQG